MDTNSNTEKYDILGYINGYIMSICGKPRKFKKKEAEEGFFTLQISTSAKGCVGMFGTLANINAGPIDTSASGTVTDSTT